MELEESFYGREVVRWSCLRIAMISENDFRRDNEREKYIGLLQMAGSKTKRKGCKHIIYQSHSLALGPDGKREGPHLIKLVNLDLSKQSSLLL